MTTTIINGAGMVVSLGTDDRSKRVVPVTPEQIPQHLPIYFLFAQRGKGRALVDSTSRAAIFGDATFDERGLYFNHATLFCNETNAQANSHVIQRVLPTDAGPRANAILWLDILETTVDRYQRLPDGSIAVDELGDPTIISTTPGIKAKWVKTIRATVSDQETFGNKTQAQGDQTDPDTNAHSVRYPIFELEEYCEGADGNNTGFRLFAPTAANGASMPTKMMNQYQTYPYIFQVLSRPDANTSPKPVKTLTGETQVMFTFKQGVINPTTARSLGWDQIILQSYNQIDVPGYPDIFGRVNKMSVYYANIQTITALMYGYEADFIDANSDITEDPASAGLLNFVTGVSSQNIPYESYVFVDSQTSVRMSEYSNIMLEGGSDGTMSNEMYEAAVITEMARYADTTDVVQDLAGNPESYLYDSGFSLDGKFALAQFISIRKDTLTVLGCHTVGEPELTEAEEHSVAVSLRTRLQMYPESTYFGTPVMRAMIMGRSGLVRDSLFTKPVPLTFEINSKFSKYMGAGNGAWKSGSSPEGAPGNIISRMKNINITWTPENVRNQNWDVGLNWIQRYDRDSFIFPHYKTVYNDDTSVLNSMLTASAIAQLNKVGYACWLEYVGRSDLSGAQLCDRCNAFISQRVDGKFDNRFTIIPEATITDTDNLRGFSWTLPIKLGADNMRTVMTTYVEAYRKADLTTPTGA